MTRPQMIRADTIDLQDQESPSAKDHTRQPAHPAPFGDGPPAPHQERALKHAEQESAVELHHSRSPRVSQDLSGKELQLLQDDGDGYVNPGLVSPNQDQQNIQRHGGTLGGVGLESDEGDIEGDDGLEDDMMDKISSSPSIDDGGYRTLLPWPTRGDSLHPRIPVERVPTPPPHRDFSSSPYLLTPPHLPLSFVQKEQPVDDQSEDHHHQGGYQEKESQSGQTTPDDSFSSEMRDQVGPMLCERHDGYLDEDFEDIEDSHDADFDPHDLRHLLLPSDDPLLDNSFDDASISKTSSESSSLDSRASWDGKEQDGNIDDDDDDTEDISFTDDSRYIDSGWGGECLRDTEDIDFEFVYALHTFVATVEGQANATKGDTMVLLDDSNSYWWLVRVVKDSSIGYLPAEHIETPTERLARLNKHRNIDLSQTMLGDNPEKSKNPLKKAMRRRNAKAVQFTDPTYFSADEADYSTEEDEEGDEYALTEEEGAQAQGQDHEPDRDENGSVVEPLKPRERDQEVITEPQAQATQNASSFEQNGAIEKARTSDELFDSTGNVVSLAIAETFGLSNQDDVIAAKSRKGTVRNTDSFFKDDNVETRKINLTPSLLRDDLNGSINRLTEAKELRNRPSLDSLDKSLSPQDRGKDDKKRKEKKGMLSGIFKRRDKKGKGSDEIVDDNEKTYDESLRQSPQPSHSSESVRDEGLTPRTMPQPQRQTSKLQKNPPSKLSPKTSINRGDTQAGRLNLIESTKSNIPPPSRSPPQLNVDLELTPLVDPEPKQVDENIPILSRVRSTDAPRNGPAEAESPNDSRRGMFSPIRDALRSPPSSSEPKPEKTRKAKHRMPLHESDSSSEAEDPLEPTQMPEERESPVDSQEATRDRLSESPVEVTVPDQGQIQHPPALLNDSSSQEEPSASPTSPLSSPEIIEAPDEMTGRDETPVSTTQPSTNAPTWSDAHLRAYLEDDREIRDLLVVVHDKVDVPPASRDHPIVRNLFKEENRKLGEMSTRLDTLLGDWLAKKTKAAPR